MRVMQLTQDGGGGYTLPSDIPTDFSTPSVPSLSTTPQTDTATNLGGFGYTPAQGAFPATAPAVAANPQSQAAPNTDPTWLTSTNQFLTSPLGQLVGAAVPAAYGMTQAASAQRNANALTNAISGAARPGLNLSNATYGQLTGGPAVGGPMGGYIAGTTGAANQLAKTAGTYATGQLTPAQKLQVSQNQAAQNAAVMSSYGRPGGMGIDSSATQMMQQQNANNAAMLTQAIEQNNIQIAAAALKGATDTYNQLLSSALSQANLGALATSDAVRQQLAANQQVSQQIQAIMQQIAKGMTTAQQPQQPGGGGAATGGGAVAQSPGQTIGSNMMGAAKQVAGWFGGGTPVTPAVSQADLSSYMTQGSQDLANMPSQPLNLSSMDTGNFSTPSGSVEVGAPSDQATGGDT